MNRREAALRMTERRIKNAPPVDVRFWSKVDRRGSDECWPWTAAARNKNEGYGAFWYQGRHHPAQRMALVLTGTEVPAGMVVCHKCDNPPCCNPAHLFVGTTQDNDADRKAKGRAARGSKNGAAKVTEMDVWKMRRLRSIGMGYEHIGKYFNASYHLVHAACNKWWQHIDMEALRKEYVATSPWVKR